LDALSEPKEPFWIPIDGTNLPKDSVLSTRDFKTFVFGVIKFQGASLVCINQYDSLLYPTHYHDISKYPKP